MIVTLKFLLMNANCWATGAAAFRTDLRLVLRPKLGETAQQYQMWEGLRFHGLYARQWLLVLDVISLKETIIYAL
jgi:hypothetical protein